MKLTLVVALVAGTAAHAGEISARVVGPMVQVFPSSVPAGEPEARIEAARGEWEPFQIVVHAAGGALHGVRAEATALTGAGQLAAPHLYRVEFLDVKTPSSIEGHAGPWPDALVPDVDAFAGEKRRAFPFDIAAGEARAIWVELFVPESAAAGAYRGSVRVTAEGRTPATIPVALEVHKFALPKSSSLPVTFGFSAGAVAKAHPGLSPQATARLVDEYEVSLLRHRISAHGGTDEPAPWKTTGGKLSIDWAPYDAEVAPFLDGTADRGGPADGARWSAFDFRVPQKLQGAERAEYARQLAAHLRARGWLGRVFDYTYDEPPVDKLDEVRQRAAEIHRAVPEVPRLVTRALDPTLHGSVDIWCPIINFVDDKPGNSKSPARAAYDEHLGKHGERMWWYQSCMSHGCNVVGDKYFTGWPSYVVDAPAMSHRIMEWLTFRYRVGGELYYDTVEGYASGKDPWRDQLLFGGNGDGTLFYPGRARTIGGTRDIPVESVRLALIREGLEDYEYLRLYAKVAGEKEAQALAETIAGKTYRWEHDPQRLYAARHKMAEAIDRAVASGGGIGVTAR